LPWSSSARISPAGAVDDQLGAAAGVRLVEPLAVVIVARQVDVDLTAQLVVEEGLEVCAVDSRRRG
jgi:hypothetical protein